MALKHKHHIIPVHMGGSDDPSNMIDLTVEEHAEEHRKLYEAYGRWQDYLAWCGLSGRMNKEEIIRYKISKTHKGKKLSEEHIKILVEKGKKLTGNNNPMFGKTLSLESRKKISEANKNKIISEETRKKMSIASAKKKHTEKTIEKISNIQKERWANGVYDAEKLRLSRIGFKQPQSQKDKVSKALSKTWEVIDPKGNTFIIQNLTKFCRENNLDQGNLSCGKHKGWKAKKIDI